MVSSGLTQVLVQGTGRGGEMICSVRRTAARCTAPWTIFCLQIELHLTEHNAMPPRGLDRLPPLISSSHVSFTPSSIPTVMRGAMAEFHQWQNYQTVTRAIFDIRYREHEREALRWPPPGKRARQKKPQLQQLCSTVLYTCTTTAHSARSSRRELQLHHQERVHYSCMRPGGAVQCAQALSRESRGRLRLRGAQRSSSSLHGCTLK